MKRKSRASKKRAQRRLEQYRNKKALEIIIAEEGALKPPQKIKDVETEKRGKKNTPVRPPETEPSKKLKKPKKPKKPKTEEYEELMRLNELQVRQAENFRNLLLNYHGIGNKRERELFEKIVRELTPEDLTRLSRQYKDAIQVWGDSEGEAIVIAQDLLNRIRSLGKATLKNAVKAIRENRGAKSLTKKKVQKLKKEWNDKAEENEEVVEIYGGETVVNPIPSETMSLKLLKTGPYAEKYKNKKSAKSKKFKTPKEIEENENSKD